MPDLALPGAGGAGDSDVAEDVFQRDADTTELELLGGGVHARGTLLELPAGTDVAVELRRKFSIRLGCGPGNGEMSAPRTSPKTPRFPRD